VKKVLGSNNPRATLNEEQVYEIKKLLMNGTSRDKIVEMFDSRRQRIDDIANLQSWLHVHVEGFEKWVDLRKGRYITQLTEENADLIPRGAKIPVKTAHAIKTIVFKQCTEQTFERWQQIARQFQVTDEIVYHIAKGMTWRYLQV
jgi:hypothetical protein